MSDYTENQLVASLCVFEHVMEKLLDNNLGSFWVKLVNQEGHANLRSHISSMGVGVDAAYQKFAEFEIEVFDWEFVPAVVDAAVEVYGDSVLSLGVDEWIGIAKNIYPEAKLVA